MQIQRNKQQQTLKFYINHKKPYLKINSNWSYEGEKQDAIHPSHPLLLLSLPSVFCKQAHTHTQAHRDAFPEMDVWFQGL